MSEVFWLSEAQIARLRPFFPKARGKPRVDDPLRGNGLPANRVRGRVLSGIIYIQRNGLMWKDAPRGYGPRKTLYNRWTRWCRMGVFATIMTELAAGARQSEIVMIDVEPVVRHWSQNHWRGHVKAHRTASSLRLKKGGPMQTGVV